MIARPQSLLIQACSLSITYATFCLSQRRLTYSNDTVDGHINTRCVTRSIAQKVHIRASQLLDLCQPRDTPVVLQLLLPVWLLLNPVRHSRLH